MTGRPARPGRARAEIRGLRFRAWVRALRAWRRARSWRRAAPPAPARPAPCGAEEVDARLAGIAARADARVGVAAVHLQTGRVAGHDAEKRFPMASTVKVPMAMQLLSRVERGGGGLGQRVMVSEGDAVPGPGLLAPRIRRGGMALPVRWLLDLMLTESDNTASDVVLGLAGGVPAVREYLRARGIAGMTVDRPIRDLLAAVFGAGGAPGPLEGRRAAAAGFLGDARDTTTPAAMVQLLAALARGEALGPAGTALLLDIMRRCATGPDRLPALLPAGTRVAHKTGWLDVGLVADVGVVELPGGRGTVALAVYVLGEPYREAEYARVIAEAAQAVCEGLAGAAVGVPAATGTRGSGG